MNIKRAKKEIENTIRAYLSKDSFGDYVIPAIRQRPILLIGAPGIGKTQIMEQIARECGIALVSYTITHHTRQSAIGLPFIREKEFDGKTYSVTEYTMSEIIGSVYEQMEKTHKREGILFIDEINCVSETLAPAMLQFLQCKSFGNRSVPEGWVIVAAGNPPEYNRSVREFDVVTLDRVKRIEVEPDFEAFKEYAYGAAVHPAVLSYLELKKENFYRMETSVDGKRFATARGWEDLSELMRVYEKLNLPVDREVVFQYIQHEKIAKDFANYVELYYKYRTDYQIRGILRGEVKEGVYERLKFAPFDERFSVVGLLLAALFSCFAEAVEADRFVTELFEKLKAFRAALAYGEDPDRLLLETANRLTGEAEAERENGVIDRKTANLRKTVGKKLEDYAQLLKADGIRDGAEAFEAVRAQFALEAEKREQLQEQTMEALEYAFDFMERAFGESQEMVIFITELTVNGDSAQFLAENDCGRFYKYNRGLLADENRQDILREIGEVEMLMHGNETGRV